MKHDDPKLIDALAAEYVLGTLRGAARRRFERWRGESWYNERRVQAWEDRFVPLAFKLRPVEPSPQVWAGIEKRIGGGSSSRRGSWLSSPALRSLAAAFVLVVVLAGGFAAWRITQGPALAPLATIAAANGQVAWQIEVNVDHSLLRAVAAEGVRPSPGRSFELWALPDNGGAPVSLGILPDTGRSEHALTERQRQALGRASRVAVSFEPAGGSPTGAPTGPVLFVAERIKSA
jgi:anti-sigma-K factor RskA